MKYFVVWCIQTEAPKSTQKDEASRSVKSSQKLEVPKLLLKDESSKSVKSSQKIESSKSARSSQKTEAPKSARLPQKTEAPRSPQRDDARLVKSSKPHHQDKQHKEDALQSLYMPPLMNNEVPSTQNTNYYFQPIPSRNFYIGTNIPENDDIFNRPNINSSKSGNIYYFGKFNPYY